MKEATESEYAISQKLAYETAARRGLEVEFEVVLKSLQSDQITIAGYEVELNDLKGAANYAMSCIPLPEEGEHQQLSHPEISNFRMWIERIIKQQFSHNFKIFSNIYFLCRKYSIGKIL
jgi:hypothetical protein